MSLKREQLKKIPWYGHLIGWIVGLASVFFLFIPAVVALCRQEWRGGITAIVIFFIAIIVISVLISLITNNTKKGKRYKRLGQEIEKLKTKLEYLKRKRV